MSESHPDLKDPPRTERAVSTVKARGGMARKGNGKHPSKQSYSMCALQKRCADDFEMPEASVLSSDNSTWLVLNDIGAFTVPSDAELETKQHVVVYDSTTSSLKDKNSMALSCAKLMWEMGSKNPIKIIKGGYQEFSALYPYLRTQKIIYMPSELDAIATYPVEIIPGFLYVATFKQSQDHNIIKDLNVKGNVIVAKETDSMQVILIHLPAESRLGIDNFSPHSTILGRAEKRVNQVFTVPVEDSGNEDLYSYFSDIVAFIDDHRMPDGHTVLLSSILGISRSVTVAIAYCMWSKKLALKDAYNHVKKCKENMQPTRGFIEQLSRWEEKLFGSTVTDITEPNY
ncbi:Serine/threonine/tyrosine-interacting-like protein 1 [Acropora cervicornis]|uniref:Serine/threonine/tyrosine-interacting-like protein 1 n=1 Tax=Acropora cervicornis TaxID=6130 RepID=A0AAD9V5T6_ACRCE|nr:Serine/threonine/tyrosine-interacting-like protein 1 [Acropora cervicornis]